VQRSQEQYDSYFFFAAFFFAAGFFAAFFLAAMFYLLLKLVRTRRAQLALAGPLALNECRPALSVIASVMAMSAGAITRCCDTRIDIALSMGRVDFLRREQSTAS
jgi:hypothetical protein